MPISSITLQPASNDIKAAYRPVILTVRATRTDGDPLPPVVYCDVYINGTYYKSLLKTQFTLLGGANSDWQFDIQDACQEVLKGSIAPNGGSSIVTAQGLISVYCKFRSSGFDVDGFITPEGTAPIQGTGSASPVAGTGTQSNTFNVLNTVLQHEQNQILAVHLNAYKTGSWDSSAWPLTHRNGNYKIDKNGSDYFPIVYTGSGSLSCVRISYKMKNGTTGGASNCGAYPSCPVVTGITINEVDNGDGTQTFTFTWSAPSSLVTGIKIQYRANGSSAAYTSVNGSSASGRTLTLPLGLYQFRFQMTGSCNTTTSNVFSGEGVGAPVCVPVAIVGTPVIADAHTGILYNDSIILSGSTPVTLSNFNKPSWLIITNPGGGTTVQFSGTPVSGQEATGITVSFDITNACGTTSFTQTIDVLPGGARLLNGTFVSGDSLNVVETGNVVGVPGSTVVITIDTVTNTNGGSLKVNGSPVFAGNSFNVILNGSGVGTFTAEIAGISNPMTTILGHFTITSVSTGIIGDDDSYQISKFITV